MSYGMSREEFEAYKKKVESRIDIRIGMWVQKYNILERLGILGSESERDQDTGSRTANNAIPTPPTGASSRGPYPTREDWDALYKKTDEIKKNHENKWEEYHKAFKEWSKKWDEWMKKKENSWENRFGNWLDKVMGIRDAPKMPTLPRQTASREEWEEYHKAYKEWSKKWDEYIEKEKSSFGNWLDKMMGIGDSERGFREFERERVERERAERERLARERVARTQYLPAYTQYPAGPPPPYSP
ncbi:hypothetical protein HK104_008559 [Borealophlyctis nickersoniae]|nr:hypothetical protein HK104_008559 [Borealophlyctis nickersoniae]